MPRATLSEEARAFAERIAHEALDLTHEDAHGAYDARGHAIPLPRLPPSEPHQKVIPALGVFLGLVGLAVAGTALLSGADVVGGSVALVAAAAALSAVVVSVGSRQAEWPDRRWSGLLNQFQNRYREDVLGASLAQVRAKLDALEAERQFHQAELEVRLASLAQQRTLEQERARLKAELAELAVLARQEGEGLEESEESRETFSEIARQLYADIGKPPDPRNEARTPRESTTAPVEHGEELT